MRRNQNSRLKDLAEKIGWTGDTTALAEYVGKVVTCIPEPYGSALKNYYIDSMDVPKRESGKYDIYFYQTLQGARAALSGISQVTPEVAEIVEQCRQGGMWNGA